MLILKLRRIKSMARNKHKKKKGCFFPVFLLLCVALFVACVYFPYKMYSQSSKYINATPSPVPLGTSQPKTVAGTVHTKSSVSASPEASPKSSSKPTSKPSSKPTSEPTDEPKSSKKLSVKSENDEIVMKEYENELYGFSCPYADGFSFYESSDPTAVLALRSPDGGAYEHIFVNDMPTDSPAVGMKNFVSSYPSAEILENRAGSNYYYVLIKNEDTYVYRYAEYTDDIEKGFEFGYAENNASIYEKYPQEIRDNFYLYEN